MRALSLFNFCFCFIIIIIIIIIIKTILFQLTEIEWCFEMFYCFFSFRS